MDLTLTLCLSVLVATTLSHSVGAGENVDYAKSAQVDAWLRHPVFGDPSFDSFERLPGNPIYRGSGEFAWPVNSFLFIDTKSSNWYVYVGDYRAGYAIKSRCVLLRSKDKGKSWENLGPVVEGDPKMFDKGGHTPDATVVYDKDRYHMVYDWGELNFNAEGGLAYAWADRPEGPWHRAPEPLTRMTTTPKLSGKYFRTYGGTLIRRKNDWLILGLMDSPPNSWVLFAMTAKQPQGPYTGMKILRQVEGDYFQPPLMEHFPAFVHDGWVYAPATSVALNRNFVGMFSAPVEKADKPSAWELQRHGSVWHSEDFEHEAAGLWGQTFSGQVLPDGRLLASFNSRDPNNMGTVNIASRPWSKPLRETGFFFSGHAGPSFTCLNRSYGDFLLRADIKLRGTARILWGYEGALGPDKPTSDATLHLLTLTRHAGLELSGSGWKVLTVDAEGKTQTLGEGKGGGRQWRVKVNRQSDGQTVVSIDEKEVWRGFTTSANGPLGLSTSSNTAVEVTKLEVEGKSRPAHLNYLFTEGLLGAGEAESSWQIQKGQGYRFGVGATHKGPGGIAKWNFYGTGVQLWSPTGPELGSVQVSVDGGKPLIIELRTDESKPSAVIWKSKALRPGPHCLVVKSASGMMALDGIEVIASKS